MSQPMPDVTDASLDAAEAAIDRAVDGLPLDAASYEDGLRALCITAEDQLRAPIHWPQEPLDLLKYHARLDATKYALKHAISAFASRRLPPHVGALPMAVPPELYMQAGRLLNHCVSYQSAVVAFTGYHAKLNVVRLEDDCLAFRPGNDRDMRFRVRNLLESAVGGGANSAPSPVNVVLRWLLEAPPRRLVVAARRTRPGWDSTIDYNYSPDVAEYIVRALGQGVQLIPTAWTSSYGTGKDVECVLRGIVALCAYHVVMVNAGATIHRIEGAALHSILLRVEPKTFEERLFRLPGVRGPCARRILDLLRFGSHSVKSPDPVLQPLFTIGSHLMVCPLLVCSSFVERNFLTLLARVDAPTFDGASHAFEKQMTERLMNAIAGSRWLNWINQTHSVIAFAGEIDCLLLDPESHTILLLELWWSIPSGEMREAVQREKTAAEKALQAARKLRAVQGHLPAVLANLGVNSTESWSAYAVVVSENFLPSTQSQATVPVVSRRTLQHILRSEASLADAHARIASDEWLPTSGEHYEIVTTKHEIGGVCFSLGAIRLTASGIAFASGTMAAWDS